MLCMLTLPAAAVFGQQPERTKKTSPSMNKPAGSAAKGGAKEASCDGALDIVPSQPMTFARKRRPTRIAPASQEIKALKNKAGESQN